MLDQYREEFGTTIMSQRDPNLVTSGRSGVVTQDGVKVEICIVRLEHEKLWTLEVVKAAGRLFGTSSFPVTKKPMPNLREPSQLKACKPSSTRATSFHLGAEMIQAGTWLVAGR